MRILALETSAREASIAVLDGTQVLSETRLGQDQRTARSFAPGIASQLESASWKPRDVQLVAVTVGPGSFTGLRIGVTAAKTFAYAVGAEVLAVDTLQAAAAQCPAGVFQVTTVMDAQRQQVFVASFERTDDAWLPVAGAQIIDNQAWLESLAPGTVVSGPGLNRLHDRLPADVSAVDSSRWQASAVTVGKLGLHAYQAGQRDDLWRLVPKYYRKSAAEEKLEAGNDHRSTSGNQA